MNPSERGALLRDRENAGRGALVATAADRTAAKTTLVFMFIP